MKKEAKDAKIKGEETLMKNETKLYEEGLEKHPKSGIFFGNLMMLLWIALGTIACWFFCPAVAWTYLAFAIIMVGIVLRKLVCTNCYYYNKWCAIGWGKLSARLFKRDSIKKFSTSIGIKIAPLVYGLLSLVPLIFITISIIQKCILSKIVVLILLLLISFYSSVISRKKSCAKCKMRLICPGSAVK